MENLGVFGKGFQENLCKFLLYDRGFCDQMEEVLDTGFFELKYLQVFAKKLFGYRNKYGTHPTVEILTSILRTELGDENAVLQKQVRDFFARIESSNEIEDKEYIQSTALDFCKKQVLKDAIMKSVPLINRCSFEEIQTLITNALKLGSNGDYGYAYIKDFEERFLFKSRNPVSTGWPQIDKITHGGFGRGELIVAVAPTGAGKSHLLVHLGAHALKQGKNVVHFTLELADISVAQRYDACLTGYNLNGLREQKDAILDIITNVDGQLIVKEFPTKSATPVTLKNHLEKIKQNEMEIDMIIVDYGDLLRAVHKNVEKRHDLESIYEDLRGLAQEFDCPVITASQTNRRGLNEDVITMESISEAFNKCFVADFIFSLSRTISDRNSNIGRIFIAKNRSGPDALIYSIFMDPATVTIKILAQEEVGDIQKKEYATEQKRDLQEAKKLFQQMKAMAKEG